MINELSVQCEIERDMLKYKLLLLLICLLCSTPFGTAAFKPLTSEENLDRLETCGRRKTATGAPWMACLRTSAVVISSRHFLVPFPWPLETCNQRLKPFTMNTSVLIDGSESRPLQMEAIVIGSCSHGTVVTVVETPDPGTMGTPMCLADREALVDNQKVHVLQYSRHTWDTSHNVSVEPGSRRFSISDWDEGGNDRAVAAVRDDASGRLQLVGIAFNNSTNASRLEFQSIWPHKYALCQGFGICDDDAVKLRRISFEENTRRLATCGRRGSEDVVAPSWLVTLKCDTGHAFDGVIVSKRHILTDGHNWETFWTRRTGLAEPDASSVVLAVDPNESVILNVSRGSHGVTVTKVWRNVWKRKKAFRDVAIVEVDTDLPDDAAVCLQRSEFVTPADTVSFYQTSVTASNVTVHKSSYSRHNDIGLIVTDYYHDAVGSFVLKTEMSIDYLVAIGRGVSDKDSRTPQSFSIGLPIDVICNVTGVCPQTSDELGPCNVTNVTCPPLLTSSEASVSDTQTVKKTSVIPIRKTPRTSSTSVPRQTSRSSVTVTVTPPSVSVPTANNTKTSSTSVSRQTTRPSVTVTVTPSSVPVTKARQTTTSSSSASRKSTHPSVTVTVTPPSVSVTKTSNSMSSTSPSVVTVTVTVTPLVTESNKTATSSTSSPAQTTRPSVTVTPLLVPVTTSTATTSSEFPMSQNGTAEVTSSSGNTTESINSFETTSSVTVSTDLLHLEESSLTTSERRSTTSSVAVTSTTPSSVFNRPQPLKPPRRRGKAPVYPEWKKTFGEEEDEEHVIYVHENGATSLLLFVSPILLCLL